MNGMGAWNPLGDFLSWLGGSAAPVRPDDVSGWTLYQDYVNHGGNWYYRNNTTGQSLSVPDFQKFQNTPRMYSFQGAGQRDSGGVNGLSGFSGMSSTFPGKDAVVVGVAIGVAAYALAPKKELLSTAIGLTALLFANSVISGTTQIAGGER